MLDIVIINSNFTLDLADEAATLAFATNFANTLVAGQVIYLHGDLGAGKTTFVRGVLHALGHIGKVKSPTYNLVESYQLNPFQLYHFDLYRFNDDEEWEEAGFREYFNAQSICFIEWPEKAKHVLPTPDIDIFFEIHSQARRLMLTAHTQSALEALTTITSLGVFKP
jgi:tRNA threonylcarbamoyladenosine biosynthesis protein TsaE